MNNEEFQRMSEETAAKLADAIADINISLKESEYSFRSAIHQMWQLQYLECHIKMMLFQNYERRFASKMAESFFLRPYYRRKYRKARRNRINIQRAMIRARIMNADNAELITEFDKIDRMHL